MEPFTRLHSKGRLQALPAYIRLLFAKLTTTVKKLYSTGPKSLYPSMTFVVKAGAYPNRALHGTPL
jgi:hypothetical protein